MCHMAALRANPSLQSLNAIEIGAVLPMSSEIPNVAYCDNA
jgi:hypothetical protein